MCIFHSWKKVTRIHRRCRKCGEVQTDFLNTGWNKQPRELWEKDVAAYKSEIHCQC